MLSPAAVAGGVAFVTHSEVGLLAYDVEDGRTLAVVRTGSGMSSVPVIDRRHERLYALSNRGALYVFALGRAAAG